MLYGANLRFNSVVNTKLPAELSHRRSTTVSLETYPLFIIDINITRRTIYLTSTYPAIVINVDYLNKWSSHSIKLPNWAKSWPLKSLYAFTDSSRYYVGLLNNYPVQLSIWGIHDVPLLFLISDSFQNWMSVRTHWGFSDCFVGVSCDYLVVSCCDMCDCWTVGWDAWLFARCVLWHVWLFGWCLLWHAWVLAWFLLR